MKKAPVIVAVVVFVASYVILTFYVAPLLSQKGARAPLDEAAIARFPVLVVIRPGADAKSASYAVAQMRNLPSVTANTANYSFLLPVGSNKVADQDGDPASYTAEESSPGRQRIQLQATVGDYTHSVEYEAEEKKVFPLRYGYTGPQLGLYTIPLSLLLSLLALWLIRRGTSKSHQPEAGKS